MDDERSKAIAVLRELQQHIADTQAQDRMREALKALDSPAQLSTKDGSRSAEFWEKVPRFEQHPDWPRSKA